MFRAVTSRGQQCPPGLATSRKLRSSAQAHLAIANSRLGGEGGMQRGKGDVEVLEVKHSKSGSLLNLPETKIIGNPTI